MTYRTIPPSVGASSISVAVGTGLTGDGSALTPLDLVPASALTPGSQSIADFNKLATVPTGNGILIGAWRTGVVNLAATGTTAIDMPLAAGQFFNFASTARLEVITRDATLTTGLTFNVAQNGVALATGATGLTVATATLNGTPRTNVGAAANGISAADMTTFPLQFIITTAVAGAGLTTCTGRFVVLGYYST